MSKYTDNVLGHADESDGIEEYDNPLPDWWLGLFFVTVIWGGFYAVDYHFISQDSQAGRYEAEMAMAEELYPNLSKAAGQDMSPETLALGGEVFTANCVSCHGANLGGGIGANLVDSEWIHGGTYDDIVATITNGVAAKGMPAWGPILGPNKVGAAASFILSKQGSAPAEAAEPATKTDAAEPAEGGTPDAAVADAGGNPGEAVFTANCVACHQADMTGGIGPNLIDDEWIHGGTLEDITATITNGVPEKGMITWKGVLSDEQIQQVAKYVYEKANGSSAE